MGGLSNAGRHVTALDLNFLAQSCLTPVLGPRRDAMIRLESVLEFCDRFWPNHGSSALNPKLGLELRMGILFACRSNIRHRQALRATLALTLAAHAILYGLTNIRGASWVGLKWVTAKQEVTVKKYIHGDTWCTVMPAWRHQLTSGTIRQRTESTSRHGLEDLHHRASR